MRRCPDESNVGYLPGHTQILRLFLVLFEFLQKPLVKNRLFLRTFTQKFYHEPVNYEFIAEIVKMTSISVVYMQVPHTSNGVSKIPVIPLQSSHLDIPINFDRSVSAMHFFQWKD